MGLSGQVKSRFWWGVADPKIRPSPHGTMLNLVVLGQIYCPHSYWFSSFLEMSWSCSWGLMS